MQVKSKTDTPADRQTERWTFTVPSQRHALIHIAVRQSDNQTIRIYNFSLHDYFSIVHCPVMRQNVRYFGILYSWVAHIIIISDCYVVFIGVYVPFYHVSVVANVPRIRVEKLVLQNNYTPNHVLNQLDWFQLSQVQKNKYIAFKTIQTLCSSSMWIFKSALFSPTILESS